jgi:hypothetical protein
LIITPPVSFILAAIAVIFLPGAAVIAWVRPRSTDPLEYLSIAGGISLSFGALSGVFLFQTGLTLAPTTCVFLYLICLLGIAAGITFHLLRDWVFKPREDTPRGSPLPAIFLTVFGLAALGGLVFLRFTKAQGLEVGPWVDSVAHTYWVQLMVAAGGVPRYLLPGMPGAFAPYPAFDMAAAAFTALARLPAATGTLWMSLLASCLVPLSLYRLGRVLWADWKPAALGALLSAFAFTFPAFLLGWGRSSVLTLFVLFPLAAAEVIRLRLLPYRGGEFWKSFALLLILCMGAFLSDPAAVPLMVLLLAAEILARFITPQFDHLAPRVEGHALAGVTIAYVLVLPYLRWVQENTFVPSTLASNPGPQPLANLTFFIATPLDAILTALAVFGLVLLIIQRRSPVLVILSLLMVLLSLPVFSTSIFSRGELRLVLCLPSALLAGYFLAEGAALIARGSHRAIGFAILAVETAGFVLWGLNARVNLYPPAVILADQADMKALDWIQSNTPTNARFLNQPAPWQSGIFRGVDGGYWILNETGRGQILPPPQYPSGGESYQSRINGWAKNTLSLTGCGKDLFTLMEEANLQYIYMKEGRGVLSAADLDDCPGLLAVYEKDGITILRIIGE